MGVNLSVQVLRSGQPVAQLAFDSEASRTIKIGRLTTAQIKLEDPKVSRIHAVIEFSGQDASLIDMGSTQGTLVNGTKVNKVKLNHGDQVLVGDTTLVLGFGSPAALPAGAAPAAAVAAPAASPPPAAAPAQTHAPAAVARPAFAGAGQPAFAGAGAGGPVIPVTQDMARSSPSFDPGQDANTPVRRITQERLRSAAVESRPHPALQPEDPLTTENRVLELRYYWGEVLLGMYHYVQPKKVTIGESTRTNIFLSSEGLPREEFPLIRYRDGDYVFSYTSQMEGEVEHGGKVLTLKDAIQSLAQRDSDMDDSFNIKMADDTRVVLHWGGATFALRFVAPPKLVKPPMGKNIDLQYVNAFILSFFLHIALIVTLSVYPHETDALKVDLFGEPDRFASLILEAPKEDKAKTKDMIDKLKKMQEEKKEQTKPEEKKPQDKPKADLKTVPKVQAPRPQPTESEKKAEVAKKFSKLFGGSAGGGALLGGGGGGSLSGTLQNVIGTAGAGSASAGMAGLGIRGTGPVTGGGLGTSRGIAGIGTTGRLGGGGLGYGAGVGLGSAKARPTLDFETPQIEGALPADVIKKVINENKNQVRYCYEVELQRNQNLEGRVLVKWIIGATGGVVQVAIKDSTIKNASVENCLMGKIRNWKFPPPAGGGTVEVNYPFVFKAS